MDEELEEISIKEFPCHAVWLSATILTSRCFLMDEELEEISIKEFPCHAVWLSATILTSRW
ncbi:hypothetical protein Glove_87g31 [Diversispora epigaea]|uniref:Uncharacterized protein n=1 Tax=Diversispora epigaea TaxID=1348612 RepID=A0A397JAK2_9GLOM|nr:hypothetical protein Glove_87g31 [Diversispora epigaea]